MSPTLAIALLLAGGAAQEPPSFGVGIQVVYLDVFVTRQGESVQGLTAGNFVVEDNGVRQRARLVDLEEVPIGVILAFDTSASLAGEGLRHLREAGHAILDGLGRGDQAALITFDYSPRLRVGLTSDVARVRQALDGVQAQGSTALNDGLYAALALPTGGARPLVVLFTDGRDTASWLAAPRVLEDLARSDAVVQVVAVEQAHERSMDFRDPGANRHDPESRWLVEVAERTGGLYWPAESTRGLKAAFLSVLEDMASRYVLAFEPEGVPLEGVHELSVRLEGARGDVRARKQYVIQRGPL